MTKLIDAIEPTGPAEQVRAEIREMTEDELDLIRGGTAVEYPLISLIFAVASVIPYVGM
jgi:hypothetical protein